MSSLNELRTLLGGVQPSKVGKVVEIGATSLRVKSQYGVRDFPVVNASAYRLNDLVRFQGDVLIGKIPSEASLPVYPV